MKGVAHYCYAELPPMRCFDSDGRTLGGRGPARMTPESAYCSFQYARPVAETPLVPTEHEGNSRNTARYERLVFETVDWGQLYNPPRVMEVVPPAVARSRAADGPTIEDSRQEE